jgi:hypothetical protein
MTHYRTHTLRLAHLAAAILGLSAFAASAQPVTPFGAKAGIAMSGGDLVDGGAGSFSASKNYIAGSGANGVTEYAAANLVDGKLHASSLATHATCERDSCDQIGGASYAAMWDTVYFHSKDGGPLENISLIPLFLDIDGDLGGLFAKAKFRTYYGPDSDYSFSDMEWQDLSSGKLETLDSLVVPLTNAPIYVYFELWTEAMSVGIPGDEVSRADFGNTMSFNWILPDDVVAESASGVFMTGLGSAVPEPATWAMMITGFGLVGVALRRRPVSLNA